MALLKVLLMPLPWILFLLIVGLILIKPSQNKRRIKIGRYVILAGTLILFALSLLPVSNFIIYSLEGKYVPVSDKILSSLDIVVILDGGLYAVGSYKDNPEPAGITSMVLDFSSEAVPELWLCVEVFLNRTQNQRQRP